VFLRIERLHAGGKRTCLAASAATVTAARRSNSTPNTSVRLVVTHLLPSTNTPYIDREDASSMVTAGATANTTEGNSRASRESGLLCSHSHWESIDMHTFRQHQLQTRRRHTLNGCMLVVSTPARPLRPPPSPRPVAWFRPPKLGLNPICFLQQIHRI